MQRTTKHCPYCGEPLQPMEVTINGISHLVGYGPCHCDEAREEREANLRAENEEKARKQRNELLVKLKRSGIPERYYDAYHPIAQEHADAIMKNNRGLYVYGPQGTGKTMLVTAIGRILVSRKIPVYFVVATKAADAMRSREQEDREFTRKLATVKTLIVDDLDKVDPTPYACERFWDLMNDRYNADLPTLVTANIERGAIIPKFSQGETGKAIASRLAGMTDSLYLGGVDRRLQNA